MPRLLDESDASLVRTIETVAAEAPGVLRVSGARAHWIGRRVLAVIRLELDPDTRLASAHALGEEVSHRLYHEIEPLEDVIVHLDPAGDATAHKSITHHKQ